MACRNGLPFLRVFGQHATLYPMTRRSIGILRRATRRGDPLNPNQLPPLTTLLPQPPNPPTNRQFDPHSQTPTPEYPYNVRIGQEICAIPSDRVKLGTQTTDISEVVQAGVRSVSRDTSSRSVGAPKPGTTSRTEMSNA